MELVELINRRLGDGRAEPGPVHPVRGRGLAAGHQGSGAAAGGGIRVQPAEECALTSISDSFRDMNLGKSGLSVRTHLSSGGAVRLV